MRVAIAVLLVAGFAAAQSVRPSEAFNLGVLRQDGMVIPFATFDGRRWSAHWPAPSAEPTVPINISSVPSKWWGDPGPRESWTAVLGTGTERVVRVTRPDVFDAQCYLQVGLRTDYQPDEVPAPPMERPYPKDGLAVSPPHAVEPIAVMPVAGEDARAISDIVQTAFNNAEAKTLGGLEHPMKRSAREAMAPIIEALYAHGTEPRVFYVEAMRKYETMGRHECELMAFGTGWFVRERGVFRELTMTVDETDCERHGASYMLPLGVIRTGPRVFWIVQFSGWDHERYVVIEPKAKSVDAVLNVWGGGCNG